MLELQRVAQAALVSLMRVPGSFLRALQAALLRCSSAGAEQAAESVVLPVGHLLACDIPLEHPPLQPMP